MYTYRVSNDDTNSVKNLAEAQDLDVLKRKIDNINKSFDTITSNVVPDSVPFQRMDQISKSEDEMLAEAQNSLAEYKDKSIKKIYDDAFLKQQELQSDIQSLASGADEQKSKLKDAYAQARQSVSDDALKRGLARSSIVINNLDALTTDELKTYTEIDNKLTNSINAINFQISAIERQKENALNDFDIEYAVKLENKLTDLKNDLSNKQLEITKYNNEISKLENDYLLKYATLQNTLDKEAWDKEYDLVKIAGQYGSNMLNKYKASKVYDLVKDYLKGFTHDEALHILESSDYLKGVLGDKYSTMIKEL